MTTGKELKKVSPLLKNPVGRKPVITDSVVRELCGLFEVGATVEQACNYAGVGVRTLYDAMDRDVKLTQKIDKARSMVNVSAKRVVANEIIVNKDVETSKWHLEKTEYKNKEAIGFEDKEVKFVITRG